VEEEEEGGGEGGVIRLIVVALFALPTLLHLELSNKRALAGWCILIAKNTMRRYCRRKLACVRISLSLARSRR